MYSSEHINYYFVSHIAINDDMKWPGFIMKGYGINMSMRYSPVMLCEPLFKLEIIPVSWFFLNAYLYGLLNDPLVNTSCES